MGLSLKSFVKHAINPVSWIQDATQWAKDIRDHNEHVAKRQNELQRQAIAEQNEYNTPANQMQRLLDAGLNPNLAYSNVDTGNQKSTANYQTHDNAPLLEGLIGHAFNAIQLFSSLQSAKAQQVSMLEQARHQQDVLQFQKDQAAINNAFRQQELSLRSSSSKREYERWNKEFEEKVRHNKSMENKSLGGFLGNLLSSYLGYDVTDVGTSAGRMLRNGIKQTAYEIPYDVNKLSMTDGFDLGKVYWKLLQK